VKRKFGIALVLALVAILAFSGTALAWDYEDPCVAANEDFIGGGGFDDDVMDARSGAQPWPYYKVPNEGYSLYRDDVTDSGNLDQVYFLTFTPDAIDLPIIASYGPYTAEEVGYEGLQADYPYEGLAEYWHMGGETSPDTWYWALEPRGYDDPPVPVPDPNPAYLLIILPDASIRVPYCGGSVYSVDVNDGTWALHIPRGTSIRNPDGSTSVRLVIDSDGNIVSDVRFVYSRDDEVTVTRWGP